MLKLNKYLQALLKH